MFTTFPTPPAEAEAPPRAPAVEPSSAGLVATKRLIWLYFWLLIFEGALRKWILPGWSNPLLIIRDPVVIGLYVVAATAGLFPRNAFLGWIAGLGLLSLLTSELAGDGNLLVSLFGWRTHFLHLPLIFLVPKVFTKTDLDVVAKWFFISSVPMCLLVLAQFQAPPDHWLNHGVGGSENGQLESAYGRIRPPGTFSFTAGLVSYLSVCTAFALQTLMQREAKNHRLATIALPALAIMVGISGSRSALSSVILVLAAGAVICFKKPAFFGRSAKLIMFVGAAYYALSFWSEFQQGIEVHRWRLEGGGGVKDGIVMRFFGGLLPLEAIGKASFFGAGLGMGTNAVSGFLYGHRAFSLGEGDWDRVIGESGPILGLAFIFLRVAIVVHLAIRSFEALKRDDPLPLLLFAAAFLPLLNGQFGVPMILGWAVFSSALCLASTHRAGAAAPVAVAGAELLDSPAGAKNFRGRSIYADQLHGEFEDPDIARFGP